MQKRAVIHVENTENVLELAGYLHSAGWGIISANKTENLLKKEKIPVIHEPALTESSTFVNDTSTLIRRILLSKYNQQNPYIAQGTDENNIFLVCINVTPDTSSEQYANQTNNLVKTQNFPVTSVLRNAFANYENLLILTDPTDYKEAIIQLKTDNISIEFRTYLAAKALNLISAYDAGLAASVLTKQHTDARFMNYLMYPYKKNMVLHEGANSQQLCYLYRSPNQTGALNGFLKFQGKDLNYTLITEVSFAWDRISALYAILKNQYTVKSTNCDGYDFTTQFTPLTGTVFTIAVKFNAIIGAALATNVLDSFKQTYTYDKENITDAVLACSSVIDGSAASEIIKGSFIGVVAPSFTDEAKEIFAANRNIRLFPSAKVFNNDIDGRLINGGALIQTRDSSLFDHWHVRTKNRPSQFKTDEMAFGMLLAMGATSYSAILIKNNAVVGIAQGCTSVNRALMVVYEDALLHAEHTKSEETDNQDNSIGDVLICDSTIKFDEPVKKLIDNGITAIIQTGGTLADNEFVNYCDERGIVMVFTDMHHISF